MVRNAPLDMAGRTLGVLMLYHLNKDASDAETYPESFQFLHPCRVTPPLPVRDPRRVPRRPD